MNQQLSNRAEARWATPMLQKRSPLLLLLCLLPHVPSFLRNGVLHTCVPNLVLSCMQCTLCVALACSHLCVAIFARHQQSERPQYPTSTASASQSPAPSAIPPHGERAQNQLGSCKHCGFAIAQSERAKTKKKKRVCPARRVLRPTKARASLSWSYCGSVSRRRGRLASAVACVQRGDMPNKLSTRRGSTMQGLQVAMRHMDSSLSSTQPP